MLTSPALTSAVLCLATDPTLSAGKVSWLILEHRKAFARRRGGPVRKDAADMDLNGSWGDSDWFLWAASLGSAEELRVTHSRAFAAPELFQPQRSLESWKLSRGNNITNEMVLNHNKMSFPWKRFCFFKSKTKPLRLQKNMTQRLRQFGELVCSFLPFSSSPFDGSRRDGAGSDWKWVRNDFFDT